jgi:hypothetical protein
MARKTAARGPQGTPRGQRKPAPRAAIRTGKETASARALKPAGQAPKTEQRRPTRAPAPRSVELELKKRDARTDTVHVPHAEEDEDLDWLSEDEDPRSQIVEGDDDWSPSDDEDW